MCDKQGFYVQRIGQGTIVCDNSRIAKIHTFLLIPSHRPTYALLPTYMYLPTYLPTFVTYLLFLTTYLPPRPMHIISTQFIPTNLFTLCMCSKMTHSSRRKTKFMRNCKELGCNKDHAIIMFQQIAIYIYIYIQIAFLFFILHI